jgi:hypothetical protein
MRALDKRDSLAAPKLLNDSYAGHLVLPRYLWTAAVAGVLNSSGAMIMKSFGLSKI